MNSNKKYNIVLAVIFIGSILLRLGLVLYNREANDPHMPVVRYIMRNNVLPDKTECTECFQPKLFHYSTAKILSFMRLDHSQDGDAQKVVAQLINFLAGIAILIVVWIFVGSLSGVHEWVKILGFALLAFNPQLIGINSQVTNDTFLILLCTLAVYCAYFFLGKPNFVYFLFAVIFSALAVMTKTNGWVTVIAIAIAFFVRSSQPKIGLTKGLFFAATYPILVVSLILLNPLSQYVQNYQRYGSPVALNIDPQQQPLFLEKTYIPYAGILSIQDGFLTFKFGNLLEEPVTYLLDKVSGESHRTSLWTRLYGSANSVHFENYPPSWRIAGQAPYWIYRGIFILALLPAAVMLIGVTMEIYGTIKGILTGDPLLLNNVSHGLFALLFIGQTLFVMLYAYEYRIYTVMKAVFTYPGLLAFFVFFVKGSIWISSRSQIKKQYMFIAAALMIALLVLYILDVATLILQLLPNQSGFNLIADRLIRAWR
jgi:hypothetical protein